jgi:hypothetical protein
MNFTHLGRYRSRCFFLFAPGRRCRWWVMGQQSACQWPAAKALSPESPINRRHSDPTVALPRDCRGFPSSEYPKGLSYQV